MNEEHVSGGSFSRGKWVYDPAVVERPLRCYPVNLAGEVIGYLWASEDDTFAGFVRRVNASFDTSLAETQWPDLLRQARDNYGASPLQALRYWVGKPEDPQVGGVPADAEEQRVPNLSALDELTNPERLKRQVKTTRRRPTRELVDEWEGISPSDYPGYSYVTDTAVRYLPVTRGGRVLGYLWASETDEAACYLQKMNTGMEGYKAGELWEERLIEAKEEGLTPLQALRRWVGETEDSEAGGIAVDAEERVAPSLHTLERIAYGIDEEEP